MELIKKYFPEFDASTIEKLAQYQSLLKDWNQKINLVSRKNEDFIEEQHILHSLSIIKFVDFQPYSSILDLGTGGGLPGIPLAIVYPDVQFYLIDSIGKKISAVSSIIEELGLKNAQAEQIRSEKHRGDYDFVVTRAVAQSKKLVQWTRHLFKDYHEHTVKNGIIALKGGDLKEELSEVNKPYQQKKLSSYFEEEFFETKKLLYIQIKK